MREAHAHLAAFGEALGMPRLDRCASMRECLERVRETRASAVPGAWVRLSAARPEAWPEERWPTLAELDAACPDRPCVLLSFDYHAAAANSGALRAVGLRPGQRVGANGEVRADPRTGAATGLLLEDAAHAAWHAAPEPTPQERRRHILAGATRLRELGFTEVHDLHSQEWLGEALGELDRRGELAIHVLVYPNIAKLSQVASTRRTWESERVQLAGGKIFADGTLNSRTALVLEPFREPLDAASARGRAMISPDNLDKAIGLTESLGLHLAAHAIGDGAVRMVLDAIERSARGRGHRIEHCELVDEADVPRFARLGVVCSVQPCHLLTDIEVLTRQLPHRLHRVLPLRELIDAGCVPGDSLVFGSDAPIVRPEPVDSIQGAVHRRRPEMDDRQAIAPEQRITEHEAWECFGGKP